MTAVIVSCENPDPSERRSWGCMGVENYAIRMPGDRLWSLMGPITEQSWQDQACVELSEELARARRHCAQPFRVEIDRCVGVDAADPLVMGALDLIHPPLRAAVAARQLNAATAPATSIHSRRLQVPAFGLRQTLAQG